MDTFNGGITLKLIRDKIPAIVLKERGETMNVRTATAEEYTQLLKEKLLEESNEAFNASSADQLAEELADVVQVVKNICSANNITHKFFEILESKSLEKGEFNDKIILVD
jgi:predicted house-cleaning noncanonical NTP pyrophosphatase (MazG superfamily)